MYRFLARRLLGYPHDRACEYLLSFGYPANPEALTRPLRRGLRRPLDEIVHEERWQGPRAPRSPVRDSPRTRLRR